VTGETPAGTLAAARASQGAEWLVDDGTRLLQAMVGHSDDEDLKVYVAGTAAFAGWKRWTPSSHLDDGHRPADLAPATREIVRSAGEALGLRCYGIDLRLADGAFWIIDVNPFPGYRGFPEAVDALESEVRRALGRGSSP
jgi:glutathione synthase/RimK-type ligase-like ATP-grasp enzyme